MVTKILNTKDIRLKIVSKEVTQIDKKVLSLITDLNDTLKAQEDPEGVGLAAPQIGKNLRVFVMLSGKNYVTIINPVIISITDKPKKGKKRSSSSIMEGCLSLPHYYTPIKRADKVEIEYLNKEGEKKREYFTGLDAQIIQHEIDHLNGILFVDRMFEQKRPLYEHTNGEWEEVEI